MGCFLTIEFCEFFLYRAIVVMPTNALRKSSSDIFSPLLLKNVLYFTFRSKIYFTLILHNVWGLDWDRLICLPVFLTIPLASECPNVPIPFVEKTTLFPLNCLCSFVKVNWPYLCWSILGNSIEIFLVLQMLSNTVLYTGHFESNIMRLWVLFKSYQEC